MVGRLGDPNAGRVTTSSITLQGNELWLAVQEAFFLNPYKAGDISDAVRLGAAGVAGWNAATSLDDLVIFEETSLTFYVTVLAELADALELGDTGYQQPVLGTPVTDTLSVAEGFFITRLYPHTVAEVLRLSGVPSMAPHLLLADTLQLANSYVAAWGHQLRDQLRATDALAVRAYLTNVLAEPIRFQSSLLVTYTNLVADGISLGDPLAVVRGLLVLEQLGIGDAMVAKATLHMSVLERARFLDSLLRFVSGDIAETLGVLGAVDVLRRTDRSVAEGLGIADPVTPRMVLRLTAADTVGMSAVQALKMVFQPGLAEGISIAGAFISPDSDLTTWSVNTRTGAVTEYTNYDFNSFARIGMRYIGASATGLYELDGDDDAGTDIIADLKGGFLQFNGSRFAGMKAVYLGVRGGGEFFLKLEAASGETYTYKVIAEDMETTKVWIGKGLRHRYLSYELISTGQDFDLESIEFVPMLAQRRV